MQNFTERLRPLVGLNGWDYIVYWKLSDDQRFLEWLGCCCSGSESNQNVGEEHLFPVSSCRDTIFSHPRTKSCDLLSQLSTSIPTDSGIHAQTLLTNQPNWLNYPNTLDPNTLQETINGTHVLIPVPGGLVELFVTKQVGEDQQIIDLVTSQCIAMVDQEGMNHSFGFNSMSNMQSNQVLGGDENDGNKTNNHFHSSETMNLPHDISVMNFMQQFNYSYNQQQNRIKNDETFSEEYHGSFLHDLENNNVLKSNTEEENDNKSLMTDNNQYMFVDPLDSKKKQENGVGRSDSMSDCSDQNEEEDDGKYRRRSGKGNQSKNLVAERKRRKKLNDRLYNLRSLVPRISKLDRASILGDAIEFVKDLQKQVKELQDELEENSDTGTESNCIVNGNNNNQYVGGVQVQPDNNNVAKAEHGFHVGNGYVSKQKQEDVGTVTDKQTQQMEPQVEVAQIDGNEYFLKVFCEHRPGGFVKLMEALNTLGMDVVHATVTSHKGLVSNVFKVEKKESEIVEAEDVRDSLLELTRNRSTCWSHEMTTSTSSENGVISRDQHDHQINAAAAYHPHQFNT
ncbi:basic helix-loop-helix (bHLH) DNA-binding superfamily protein [Trifolium repens]|nr:basic helix-loop-helix (bHLH) DNA-binding superfamily protein [Trifolium repens]